MRLMIGSSTYDATLIKGLHLIIILSGILAMASRHQVTCETCNDLSNCVRLLRTLTSDERMAFAHTEEDLHKLCGKLREAVSCVTRFIGNCLDENAKLQYMAMTNGTQQLINDLCTPGTAFRTEYLNHAPCYRELADDYKFCAEKYYAIYDKIRRDAEQQPPEVQLRNWCCNFDNHRQCTFVAVKAKCGLPAAKLAEDIVITAGGTLVQTNCKTYKFDSPECNHMRQSAYGSRATPSIIRLTTAISSLWLTLVVTASSYLLINILKQLPPPAPNKHHQSQSDQIQNDEDEYSWSSSQVITDPLSPYSRSHEIHSITTTKDHSESNPAADSANHNRAAAHHNSLAHECSSYHRCYHHHPPPPRLSSCSDPVYQIPHQQQHISSRGLQLAV